MLGDFFTKPLQGTQFTQMRSKILNLPSSPGTAVHRSVLEKSKDLIMLERSKKSVTMGLDTRLNKNRSVIGGRNGNSKL